MPSYEQSKSSKLWSVRFREMAGGKEINKRLSGFRTKKDAQQGYLNYLAEQKPQELVEGGLKFEELVAAYLAYEKDRTKESSLYDIRKKIEGKILPFFKGKLVSEIKPIDIVAWQQSLSGYSYKYRHVLRGHLNGMLRYADRYYDIPNAMNKVDPLRNTEAKKEMLFWTEEEFGKFLAAVPADRQDYRLFFLTLYILGCRKGEALALTWDDVDTKRGIVSITKNITRKVEGRAYAVTTPKNTASDRKVSIPMEMCAEYEKYRQSLKIKSDSSAFVFGGKEPLKDRTTDRVFANSCQSAGVKKIRLHDLRHSCASLLISRGVSIVAVSKRLGHTNVEQTLNTYSHMMPSDDQMMQSVISDVLAKLGTE